MDWSNFIEFLNTFNWTAAIAIFTGAIVLLTIIGNKFGRDEVDLRRRELKPKFVADNTGRPSVTDGTPNKPSAYNCLRYKIRNIGARISHVRIEGVNCRLIGPAYEIQQWRNDEHIDIYIQHEFVVIEDRDYTESYTVKISYQDAVDFPGTDKVVVGGGH